MNKLLIYGLAVFATTVILASIYIIYNYSRVFWCATVKFTNFNEVDNNIFIENILDKGESERLITLIKQAKSRITNKYGDMASNPWIIVVDSQYNPKKYGLMPDRQAVRAYIPPWGKYLVISSKTHDVNLIAHEYFHIEISERLGYLLFKTKLPVWLDEGLAMQVDDRERYRIDNYSIETTEIHRVKTLNRSSDFFTGNNEQIINNMRAAKAAVHNMLSKHSGDSLYELFSRVRKGEDISDVFGINGAPLK